MYIEFISYLLHVTDNLNQDKLSVLTNCLLSEYYTNITTIFQENEIIMILVELLLLANKF